ncbi:MAG: EAL domain-containing protein [Erysipelotrichaceae bacterium]|nr:EAL domain-containing protein [Erysipelotrichaceae bacterium]
MNMDLQQYIQANYKSAFDNGYIKAYYQPVIRTSSKQLCSFETLARWLDPEYGLINPNEFIPVFEKLGIIHKLDEYIIRLACERIRKNITADEVMIPLSVNLSRLDFKLTDTYVMVDNIVKEYQIPHDFIYLEITESIMAENKTQIIEVVNRFRENGYQIWMDDFGSAYSSLNILKELPFDELKMDMMFLQPFNQTSKRIAASVVEMAKNINIHTLCEGVETEEQFKYLRNIGCEKVQGYLFGQPLPYEEALNNILNSGIAIESVQDRNYYDDIGRINLLSSVPFMSQEERDALKTARQLNSIPLALVEMKKDSYSILFYNSAFEQTENTTGLFADDFSQDLLRIERPFNTIATGLLRLLDSTISLGRGRMNITSNDDYYEVQTKLVASGHDKHCILLRLNNLSKESKSYNTSHLDEYIRKIYTIYERITLMNLTEDTITPLYVATRDSLVSENSGIRKMVKEYALNFIYPEDREEYIKLIDPENIRTSFAAESSPYITAIFRSLTNHGQYVWKEYTILKIDENNYLQLIKNADSSLKDRMISSEERSQYAKIDEKQLWHNLVNSDLLRLFWKDKERRFLGVTDAFLRYYGFDSINDILGKNDEEVGWHIHPDKYRNDEYSVIEEGITTHNVPGFCIAEGENKEILASKTPLYDDNGQIQGLMGYFIDKELLTVNDYRGGEDKRRDMLTGLLNSRGIDEEITYFRDEYFLRKLDFVRVHVSIDDFNEYNKIYGFDFGDTLMRRLGKAFKKAFGLTSAVGRVSGHMFVVLSQVEKREDGRKIFEKIRETAASIREVNGIPVTIYLSIGYVLFSDFPDIEEQSKECDLMLMANHNINASLESRMDRALQMFHLFDNLPFSLAVYHVPLDEKRKTGDPTIFYVNHAFEKIDGRNLKTLFGKHIKDIYPFVKDDWYENIIKAAYSEGEINGVIHFDPTGRDYTYTMSQVITRGFCAIAYRPKEQQRK